MGVKPVFVVHISHRHGSGSEVFSTHEKARAYLAAWAREWWHEVTTDEAAPADDDECISQYFDGSQDEFYDFDEVVIDSCETTPEAAQEAAWNKVA